MANKTVTVKTSGGTYTTLQAAIAGEVTANADLTAAGLDGILTIECYAMEDTTAVTVAGFTMDATHYLHITVPVADRHEGIWSTSKYRLVGATIPMLYIRDPFVRVEGLQIDNTATSGTNPACVWVDMDDTENPTDIRFDSCILRKSGHRTSASWEACIFLPADTGVTNGVVRLFNCVLYDAINGHANTAAIYSLEGDNTVTAYNCTFHNCDNGIYRNTGAVSAINCLFDNCVADTLGTVTETYCATTNDNTKGIDAAGAGNRFSQTFTYEAGTDYFQLASTDAGARDYGTSDPGSGLYSDDIVGTTRSDWDIGAFEYVAAATSILPLVGREMQNIVDIR